MLQTIIDGIRNLVGNDYLALFLLSTIPAIELRGAILAMPLFFKNPTASEIIAGTLCSIAGSATVILPLLLTVRPIINKLKRTKHFKKFAEATETRLKEKAKSATNKTKSQNSNHADEEYVKPRSRRHAKLGKKSHKLARPKAPIAKKFFGLLCFVALPLPLTGVWTGSCIGGFTSLSIWQSALAIFIGNSIAGAILTALAFTFSAYADLLLYAFALLAIGIFTTTAYLRLKS